MTLNAEVALVFPGQGSQRLGMLDAIPPSEDLERLLDAAEALSGLPLSRLAAQGPPSDLADTRAAQPLLYLADWGWGHALMRRGVQPAVMAGHSLGEYAALALAGAFSVEAGLELVIERARAMASAGAAGGMTAVLGMERTTVAALVEGIDHVWVANDNSPSQVVLSGTHQGLEHAMQELSAAGARRLVPLKVGGAFHSPLMQTAADAFRLVLDRTQFADTRVPLVQNALPRPATEARMLRERLAEQMTSPVRWTETMLVLRAAGVSRLIECGPGSVLKGLVRGMDGLSAASVEEAGVEGVLEEV